MSVCQSAQGKSTDEGSSEPERPTIEINVQRVLQDSQLLLVGDERRRELRHPYPFLIRLIPDDMGKSDKPPTPIRVVGRHISAHGLDFFSHEPLPYRRVIVEFTGSGTTPVHLPMELMWCRFCGDGWYENGGRFR